MRTNALEYLEEAAERYADKVAFADDTDSCTFAGLLDRARRIGTALSAWFPVRKPVPVFMDKSVDTIGVFMGALYAGAFYVLVDTKHPAARVHQILEVLDTDIIVTSSKYLKDLEKVGFEGRVLLAEELANVETDGTLLDGIRAQAVDMDPLYGMFTSGSTGVPKCVVVGHRSLLDFIECFTEIFNITEQDVIGNQAPWDFDVSVKDIYSGLKTGATVQIIPKRYFSFPTTLLDFLEERQVTTLIWAVSALCIISTLNGFDYLVPHKIKKVLFSGEAMPVKHLNIWRHYLPDTMFVNVYGPTEITCNCTWYIVDREYEPGDVLPMGKAFPNEKVFLLDEEDHLIPSSSAGVSGEICVSGTALALGYYRNPAGTARAFVQNPLNDCYLEKIYRTGDLAYYNEEGNLCFSSRKDFQIKHMGHRIELGEIDSAMEKVPEIKRSCCIYDMASKKQCAFMKEKSNGVPLPGHSADCCLLSWFRTYSGV